jgi:hypothetical protein
MPLSYEAHQNLPNVPATLKQTVADRRGNRSRSTSSTATELPGSNCARRALPAWLRFLRGAQASAPARVAHRRDQ